MARLYRVPARVKRIERSAPIQIGDSPFAVIYDHYDVELHAHKTCESCGTRAKWFVAAKHMTVCVRLKCLKTALIDLPRAVKQVADLVR
jgi:hypothetical protein